jgi:Icc protein
MPLTVVHVTDTHLYADVARVNDGLVPARTCETVLAAAASECPSPDAVLLTGDFTNDDSEASYALARRLVRSAFPSSRVFYVPGNHEDVDLLHRVFSPDFQGPSASGLDVVPLGAGWRLALLSTFAGPGCVHGEVSDAAVAQLDAALAAAEAAGENVLLALHHPPLPPAGDLPPWAGHCLRRPEALVGLLARHTSCTVAVHGHLHADVCLAVGHASVYCTPSTCTQTVVQSDTWTIDTQALPGYRVLLLGEGGSHETHVCRVVLLGEDAGGAGGRMMQAGGSV